MEFRSGSMSAQRSQGVSTTHPMTLGYYVILKKGFLRYIYDVNLTLNFNYYEIMNDNVI